MLIFAAYGNFYGIAAVQPAGGNWGRVSANVYRITPRGDLKILVSYPYGQQGYYPGAAGDMLIEASNGKLYGTASRPAHQHKDAKRTSRYTRG